MRYTFFYASQFLIEFDNWHEADVFRRSQLHGNAEVYHGGYLFDAKMVMWYRLDLTPVLLEDVPKVYRAWVLISS